MRRASRWLQWGRPAGVRISDSGGGGGAGQATTATFTNLSTGTASVDLTITGTTSGSSLSDGETLRKGKCYWWTLDATDNVGNTATTFTSEVVYIVPNAS